MTLRDGARSHWTILNPLQALRDHPHGHGCQQASSPQHRIMIDKTNVRAQSEQPGESWSNGSRYASGMTTESAWDLPVVQEP